MPGRLRTAIFSVAGIVLVSKALGFVREMVIADKFGTAAEYDLYLIAIMLPALAYGVLNYASFYFFVPYFSRTLGGSNDPTDGRGAIWPPMRMSVLVAVAVTAAIIVAAPYLMRIWAADYLAAEFSRIVFYSRVTAVIVVLGTVEAVVRAFLNVKNIYTYPAAGYIIFNALSILSVIFLHERFSVGAVAIGLVGGLLVQNAYLLCRLVSFKPTAASGRSAFGEGAGALMSAAGMLVLIELINRSYFLIDRYFAPQFGEGIVSALNYGQVLVQLPDAVIGFAIGAVVFPLFSSSLSKADYACFAAVYEKTISGALLLSVPLAVFLLTNAEDVVYFVFQRGAFTENSVSITAAVLRPYAPTVIALFIVSASIRACYAGGWQAQVFGFAVVLFVTKLAATWLLPRWLGYPGISAATSLAHAGYALLLLGFIVRKTRTGSTRPFVWRLGRILLAGGLSLLVIMLLQDFWPAGLNGAGRSLAVARMALSGAILATAYVALLWILGLGASLAELLSIRTRGSEDR